MPRPPMLAANTGELLQDLTLAAVMKYLPREDVIDSENVKGPIRYPNSNARGR